MLKAVIIIAAVIFAVILVAVFASPIKLLFKFLFNTCLGFLMLWLIGKIGPLIGLSLGFNLLNAVVIGILGLPGTALLLVLRWLCLT